MVRKIFLFLPILINTFAQDLRAMESPISIPALRDSDRPRMVRTLSGISDISEKYETFVVDLHGVIHNGDTLYPEVLSCLEFLRSLGKRILFLSNSARPYKEVEKSLSRRGVLPSLYEAVITSGDMAFEDLQVRKGPFASLGPHYLYLGKDDDRHLFSPELKEISDVQMADFILALNIPPDPLESYIPILKKGLKKEIPFICANPDLFIYTKDGNRQTCGGTLAQWYEEQGGVVHYYGKPYLPIYQRIGDIFKELNPRLSKFLVIGDTLRTDILGANQMKWDSVFIGSGTHREDLTWEEDRPTEKSLHTLFRRERTWPTYVLPFLR